MHTRMAMMLLVLFIVVCSGLSIESGNADEYDLRGGCTCCAGESRGNVDGSPDGEVSLGDLTRMIDYLFVSFEPLDCWEEGNVDESQPEGEGSVTLGDLTRLIDHLFVSFDSLPPCPEYGSVTDIDGNVYVTVQIGDQCWMAENLKVTHYLNSDPIPEVIEASEWKELDSGAYCNYDNDTANVPAYGRLYNWHAVDDARGLAPDGWHVPTDAEWQVIIDYLGGDEVAGGKMKDTVTGLWTEPNVGATNESGFTARPGGDRGAIAASFEDMHDFGLYWSSTEEDGELSVGIHLRADSSGIAQTPYRKRHGYSIRCVKD